MNIKQKASVFMYAHELMMNGICEVPVDKSMAVANACRSLDVQVKGSDVDFTWGIMTMKVVDFDKLVNESENEEVQD